VIWFAWLATLRRLPWRGRLARFDRLALVKTVPLLRGFAIRSPLRGAPPMGRGLIGCRGSPLARESGKYHTFASLIAYHFVKHVSGMPEESTGSPSYAEWENRVETEGNLWILFFGQIRLRKRSWSYPTRKPKLLREIRLVCQTPANVKPAHWDLTLSQRQG